MSTVEERKNPGEISYLSNTEKLSGVRCRAIFEMLSSK